MTVQTLVMHYLDEARLMQLATSFDDQPWCATLFFGIDNQHKLYWVSEPRTRHSIELIANQRVAAAITLPHAPNGKVHGVQVQGTACRITKQDEIRQHAPAYEERFTWSGLTEKIITNPKEYALYQLNPSYFVLFDQINFPDQPRQEWHV